MLKLPMQDGTDLHVFSNWDSGTHCTFQAMVHEKDAYSGTSLDKVLTKAQIQEIEFMIASRIHQMLNPTMWNAQNTEKPEEKA